MRFNTLAAGLCLATSLASTAIPAQTYDKPLGSAMEEWPYPHPVKFHPVTVDYAEPVRMAYMDVSPSTGTATKLPVVLMHGKNFYGSYWKDTISALNAAGHRVIVPDQLGFGKSSKPSIAYSFDMLATNTISLLDSLSVDKFVVVGHSMGGMVAARLTRNFPDRVAALVFENPIGLEDYRFKVPPKSTDDVYEGEMKNTDPAKIRKFLNGYVVNWKPEVFEPFVEVRSRVALGGEYPRWAMSAALTYQMVYQQPVVHEFPLIKAPTLIVIGLEDRTTLGRGFVTEDVLKTLGQYPDLGKKTAEAIPNSKLVEMPNVGHIPHLEAPEQFHQALVSWLDDI